MEAAIPTAALQGNWPSVSHEVLFGCAQSIRRIRELHPGFQSLGVTSTLRREGRSTVAAGTAVALDRIFGLRSVLMDADVGPAAPGAEAGSAEPAGVNWADPDVGRITMPQSGSPRQDRQWMADALAELRGTDVTVVADLPPLPPAGHADGLAGLVDVVVLVIRAGSTPLPAIRSAVSTLPKTPVVVLNGTKSAVPRWLHLGDSP